MELRQKTRLLAKKVALQRGSNAADRRGEGRGPRLCRLWHDFYHYFLRLSLNYLHHNEGEGRGDTRLETTQKDH